MLSILDCKIMEDHVAVDMKTMFAQKLPKRYIEKCVAACLADIAGFVSWTLRCCFIPSILLIHSFVF